MLAKDGVFETRGINRIMANPDRIYYPKGVTRLAAPERIRTMWRLKGAMGRWGSFRGRFSLEVDRVPDFVDFIDWPPMHADERG